MTIERTSARFMRITKHKALTEWSNCCLLKFIKNRKRWSLPKKKKTTKENLLKWWKYRFLIIKKEKNYWLKTFIWRSHFIFLDQSLFGLKCQEVNTLACRETRIHTCAYRETHAHTRIYVNKSIHIPASIYTSY